ncbi:DUF4878 domain-containing protein [Wohlfahrtiimonas larvae]|uniref:DUF4878 domain-containing protein n=1 Tax=Wohlfahrtiimonas larvae TaxID=1157986 RepID=A0ABP9MEC9_9GAMM|nr:DUF4878 domain-containing protein [Wohlfahrtiimonas larvae]
MKKILLYPVLAIMTLMLVACSGSTDSPEGITKHFIESTYKGDGDALIKSLDLGKDGEDPAVQQMIAGKMNMAAQEAKKEAEKNGGLASINIKDVKYTNDEKTRATVNFTVKFKKNDTEDAGDMKTIKTDKGWKISL